MRPIGKDEEKVDATFVEEVRDFINDNKIKRTSAELDPKEFLQYYLNWNGIEGYHVLIIQLMEQLGWKLEQAEPRIMTDEHRQALIDAIQELQSDMYMDCKPHELATDLLEHELNGVKGWNNESDEALLEEIGKDLQVKVKISEISHEGEVSSEDFDVTDFEAARIWAIYKQPEVLCKTCTGRGTIYDLGSPHDCPHCNGSGLADRPFQPKFTVIRERKLVEFCDVRAENAEEASKKAQVWVQQNEELVKLEVFTPDAAESPDVPGAPGPLYSKE